MVQTLKGEGSDAVVAIALDCLLALSALRPPLTAVTALHQEIFHTVLIFLPRGGAIKQRALRVCAAVVGMRTFTTLSDEQARQLLHVCRVEIIKPQCHTAHGTKPAARAARQTPLLAGGVRPHGSHHGAHDAPRREGGGPPPVRGAARALPDGVQNDAAALQEPHRALREESQLPRHGRPHRAAGGAGGAGAAAADRRAARRGALSLPPPCRPCSRAASTARCASSPGACCRR
ncbi:hypothetical protein STCU_11193 [Strigomonas culicis]|uniref:Uncharacterized protein n=1 Tax=Strigomonas culicis TaxID=28005 RepID=S9TJG0_9TRYP|nr:hypothetical protein STCU_11193 [Strigomonas culicis]|eukprot:EPY16498.1 hypothetical protein STCU_11193 [Strigomonas culicis]